MPTAQINGIGIYYEDNGSGFPVVFTHGYASTSQAWRGQIDAVAQRYRMITWDMRGHGQTDSPERQEDYSEAATVEDLAGLLRHLGIEQAVLVGHSLGGYMSLAFYLAHPEMVAALIPVDTGPGYRNPKSREGWNETAYARAVRFEERGLDALGRSPEVEASRSHHKSAVGLAKAARGMLAQFDDRVITSLGKVEIPTLLIVGENDTPFLNGMDYMAQNMPRSRKVVIPNAGHAANIDQPELFNQTVVSFLDEVVGAKV